MTKRKFRKEKSIRQHYYEKTKKYSFQVSFKYYDDNGNRLTYTKTFNENDFNTALDALNAACKHRDQIMTQYNTLGLPKNENVTLDKLMELKQQYYPKSLKTQERHSVYYNNYIKPIYGKRDIKSIKASDIQLSLVSLVDTKTDSLIKTVFGIWRLIYQTAILLDLVYRDETIKVTVPKSCVVKDKKDVEVADETIEEVINVILTKSRKNHKELFRSTILTYVIKIMYYTGIRPAECFALSRTDVDFNKNTISINKAVGSSTNKKTVLTKTKTAQSVRTIPISSALKKVLVELMEYHEFETLTPDYDGNYLEIDYVTSKLARTCINSGIKFNLYMLRHKFSTDLITTQTDVRTTMELMGHNNPSMTIDYARSNDDLKQKAINARSVVGATSGARDFKA